MTDQQIIEWAREAKAARDGSLFLFYVEDLQRFAALVAAHERERCAQVCESAIDKIWQYHPEIEKLIGSNVCRNLAKSIRALKD